MRTTSTVREARVLALWLLGGAIVMTPLLAMMAIGWLRDSLRFGCWYSAMVDEAGSWSCGDGLTLLMPGIAIVVVAVLALLVALVCVERAPFAPQPLLIVASLVAVIPTVVIGMLLLWSAQTTDASMTGSGNVPPPESMLQLWTTFALPSMVLAMLGAISAAIACLLLVKGRAPAISRSLAIVGPVALLLSCLPSLGGTLALALVGAAIALAAVQMAAALGRELAAGRPDIHSEAAVRVGRRAGA